MKKIVFLFTITFISPSFAMEQSKEETLFNAIERNDLATVKKLIENGVKINIRDKNGDTPLILAVKQKNIDIIKTILNELPNLDLENKEKKVAIEVAQALPEESASAKTLKNNIIDLLKLAEIQNDFDYAVREGRLDLNNIARLINAGTSVNIPTDERFPLVSAIKNGELKLVKLLIQHGADVNQRLKNGKTPLMYAADKKNYTFLTPEIIKILLEKGANPNVAEPNNHFTSLSYAVFGGDIDAIQLLIKAGANQSMRDTGGRTIFYRAWDQLDEAKNKLAQATTEDSKKEYQSQIKNYDKIIKFLMGEKILTDREALLQALQEVNINALKKLIPESWGLRSAFTLAREYNYLAGMNAILNTFSSDLNKQNKDGETPLMLIFNDAIQNNELSAVNLLIDSGADVNKADNVGKTPLMVAAEYSTPAIIQILLQKGANPNAVGGYSKWTPLIYAIEEGNFDVIEPLINGKANPLIKIKNEGGKDALDIAKMALKQASKEAVRRRRFQQKKQNYENIVKLLESKIPPAILEQKREQERQKQVAKEQTRQQKEREQLAEAERQRQAAEEQARQEQERQRIAREAEEARLTQERVRLAQEEERKRQERLRQEQLTRERLERERLEQQKREQEREQERLNKPLISALHNLTQILRVLQADLAAK